MIVAFVTVRRARLGPLLVAHRHRDRRMSKRRAGPDRHRDEGGLGNFLVGRALLDRALDVLLDTPRTWP